MNLHFMMHRDTSLFFSRSSAIKVAEYSKFVFVEPMAKILLCSPEAPNTFLQATASWLLHRVAKLIENKKPLFAIFVHVAE